MEINHENYRQVFHSGESIANTPWWKMFGDTTLTSLIWSAMENNKDLNRGIARIKEARAAMDIVRADLYPRINYGVDGSSSANTEVSGLSNDITGGINVSYIVDLWGRVRRLNEAALQEYLATEEAYRALTIIIVAEIANAYLML